MHYTAFQVLKWPNHVLQTNGTDPARPTILSDCRYNIVKQLEKELQFLWCVDGYIKDAEMEGNTKCVQAFRQIKAGEEKHAKMLKALLADFPIGER